MKHLVKILNEKKLTIACAESMTGGLLSSEITKIPGASKVYVGGIVAYTKDIKVNILNIDPRLIDQKGIVSKEVAIEMAKSIKDLMQSDIGIGITGDAGPTLQKGSIDRKAYYAICFGDKCLYESISFTNQSRIESQQMTVDLINKKLIETIS
jgi:PncC family amidohydrolase